VEKDKVKELLRWAGFARRAAYAPYSKYTVGAAVSAGSGQIYLGANVENVSYGLSMCAERAAVFSAVASGERKIRAIAVQGSGSRPAFPCGACRQVLAEFGSENLPVVVGTNKKIKTFKLGELLKHPFQFRHHAPEQNKSDD